MMDAVLLGWLGGFVAAMFMGGHWTAGWCLVTAVAFIAACIRWSWLTRTPLDIINDDLARRRARRRR